MVTSNPAPRVATCRRCAHQWPAPADRGPLPVLCVGCRADKDVRWRVASAVNAARRAGAPQAVQAPLEAAAAAVQDWTSYGE